MQWVYLDNNATTAPAPPVIDAIDQAHRELWANPSSVHRLGQMVRQKVELARTQVAQLIGAREREIIFTSGGTESNNLALHGLAPPPGTPDVLVTTRIEHSAIREPAAAMEQGSAVRVVYVPVDGQGQVTAAAVGAAVRQAIAERQTPGGMVLVSVQWANNETGVIQPIAAIAQAISEVRRTVTVGTRVLLHVDATQAVGKLPVDVKAVGADMLTLAAHKFHGPKGIGALYARGGVRLRAQNIGGPQERQRRGGTENTPGIIGMGVAAELAQQFLEDGDLLGALRARRDRLEAGLLAACPGAVVNSAGADQRLWNTTNIGFPRLEAEAILLGLSERGVCASAGAACSSGSLEPSPVLLAMGIEEPIAHGSVRFSLSRFTTDADIDRALAIVPEVVRRLSRTLPMGV